MKKLLYLMIGVFAFTQVSAQNSAGKSDDAARIAIKAYVPTGVGDLTPTAQKALLSRVERIVTGNGIGGSSFDNRFVMAANIVELTKDVSATTPIIYSYTLEVTLIVGDAIEGTKFSSYTFEQKGAGNSQTKAYMSAIKRIKSKSSAYTEFLDEAKTKIIEYYNSKCDFYLKEAESYVGQNEYQAAIATLTSIPQVCKECYDKAMDAVAPIYQKQIDRQCKIDMTEAKNAWNASQDGGGASTAANYLGQIDPNSSCYAEAQTFAGDIAKRIKELDQREWDFKLKQQQDEVNLEKASIKAARDIGVAYGENQPDVVNNTTIAGWW
jgi:hypothetical protein